MRKAIRSFGCAVTLLAAPCAPALAAPANGQLAAAVENHIVTVNPDGSGLRTLALPDGQVDELAWSPDGNRLAFVHDGRIAVYDLAGGRVADVSSGPGDANPAWSADGARIGFRRGLAVLRVPAGGGTAVALGLQLPAGTIGLALAGDHARAALVASGLLILPGVAQFVSTVAGLPAWSLDAARLAFATAAGIQTVGADGVVRSVTSFAGASSPRWSPDAAALVFPAGGELRIVTAAGGASRSVLTARRGVVAAADWQPCVAGVTVACQSVAPPHCAVTAASVTTQAEQPIELPVPSCADPAGRSLSIAIVKPPDHGTVSGWRYTPAAGFSGLDTLTYRVSNGAAESELVRVSVFVVPRALPAPAVKPVAAVAGAPFLTARATPRLDRSRRVRLRLACDQDCTLRVRLIARLRSGGMLSGTPVGRSIAARRTVTVRLRLPARPRGAVRTAWVTGRVRNAAGQVRLVKLPVRLPR